MRADDLLDGCAVEGSVAIGYAVCWRPDSPAPGLPFRLSPLHGACPLGRPAGSALQHFAGRVPGARLAALAFRPPFRHRLAFRPRHVPDPQDSAVASAEPGRVTPTSPVEEFPLSTLSTSDGRV